MERPGANNLEEPDYMMFGNRNARKRVVKPRNRFAGVPNEEILYTLGPRGDKSQLQDKAVRDDLEAELNSRGLASSVQELAAKTDILMGAAKAGADVTGLSRIPRVEKVMKPIPALGTALGLVQGVSQQASGDNPYGEGMPSGYHMFNDVAEGSLGLAGSFYPLAQFVFGGYGSDIANSYNAAREAEAYQALLAQGKRDELEKRMLYKGSRDWDRNKLSQLFSSTILGAENARREAFRLNYSAQAKPKELDRLLAQELADRADYDGVMKGASWFNKALTGLKLDFMDPRERAAYMKNWVKFEKIAQENARNEGIPPL
jgi:hypothetical protein